MARENDSKERAGGFDDGLSRKEKEDLIEANIRLFLTAPRRQDQFGQRDEIGEKEDAD